jgi:DNA-binding response OmpR family regulator
MARVLLVDDDRSLRRALRMGLERRGHQVDEAGDGEEALAVHRHVPADVAIVDVAMPVLGGLELAAKLRQESPGTRIVIMSGILSGATVLSAVAKRAGADEAIVKPFAQHELARLIEAR